MNQAAEHVQNDAYGEMILTLTPIYFDERFLHLRDKHHEKLLVDLAVLCEDSISKADAGLWEIRDKWQEHSFTNLMCWAGLERISRIQKRGYLKNVPFDVDEAVKRAYDGVMKGVHEGSIRNSTTERSFDASLCLAPVYRFPDQEVCKQTVEQIRKALVCEPSNTQQSFFYRYVRADDFGKPESAFLICSFWIVQALSRVGRTNEAVEVLAGVLESSNHVGLFAEHYLPSTKEQLGNFPQAYSHVGMINSAFAVSPPWSDVL